MVVECDQCMYNDTHADNLEFIRQANYRGFLSCFSMHNTQVRFRQFFAVNRIPLCEVATVLANFFSY